MEHGVQPDGQVTVNDSSLIVSGLVKKTPSLILPELSTPSFLHVMAMMSISILPGLLVSVSSKRFGSRASLRLPSTLLKMWDPIQYVPGYEDSPHSIHGGRFSVAEQYLLAAKATDAWAKYDEASGLDNTEQLYRRM